MKNVLRKGKQGKIKGVKARFLKHRKTMSLQVNYIAQIYRKTRKYTEERLWERNEEHMSTVLMRSGQLVLSVHEQ